MKFVLFVGDVPQLSQELILDLRSRGILSVQVKKADEISQVGKQNKKIVIIFSSNKIPFQYFLENKWSFKIQLMIYAASKPVFSLESQEKLKELGVGIYDGTTKDKLLKAIDHFYLEK